MRKKTFFDSYQKKKTFVFHRSGDNMEKEVFKTAASKEAYLQGIAKLGNTLYV